MRVIINRSLRKEKRMQHYMFIYDRKNKTFQNPKAIAKDVINVSQDSVLGGEDTLTFSLPIVKNEDFGLTTADLVRSEDFIEFEGKKYIIKNLIKSRTESGLVLEAKCDGLYSMLIDFVIDGEDTWLQGASLETVLRRILRNTPFTVGRCDDFGTWDIELKELNCLEAINQARDNWPKRAEIYFDGYTLHAVAQRGNDTSYQLHYKKNISDVEREEDTSGVVTRFCGLGAGGMTIEGLDATKIPEAYKKGVHIEGGKVVAKYIDAPTIGEYATPKSYTEDMNDYKDQLELLKAMQEKLKQISTPKLTYTVSFSAMARHNVPYSDIQVGDLVWINDPDFGQVKLRVAELNRDPLYIENSTVVLGERHKTLSDYIGDFESSKDIWEGLDPGIIDGKIDAAIKQVTDILNSGNNTCWITDNDGIICADSKTLGPDKTIINTTRLIKMANGAIGCSINGGQSYEQAMTPEGILAQSITGGFIHSSHIEVGDDSKFQDGYSPTDVRKPLITEFDLHKQNTNTSLGNTEKELGVLNTSVSQTNTTMSLVKKELADKIDVLNKDVSGLNGDMNTMLQMYNKVNDDLYGNSYFSWTTQGIRAIDYDMPRYQALFGAKGIGFSTDGGKVFTNAITARGIVASQVNIGTFGQEPFKGLTIRNGEGQETFAIDTNGNLSMMGNINMNGGSIAWHNVSKMPYDALDDKLKGKFTFIDSNGVYTGRVKANQLDAKGLTITNAKDQETFSVTTDGEVTVRGNIHMGPGSTIDWGTVGAPTAEQIGAMTGKEFEEYKAWANQRFTHITATGIYTNTIDAGQIIVTGPKIPANAVDITANDIGAATKAELNESIKSTNNYTTNWANNMKSELTQLERDMVTRQNVTEITHNSIKTAKVSANQIIGGELAGVRIYCDNKLIVGGQYNHYNPTIQFAPNKNYTALTYKDNSYLAMQCDEDIALYAGRRLYMQNAMRDVMFSRNGSSRPGSGEYLSMHEIVAKINECCRKLNLPQL